MESIYCGSWQGFLGKGLAERELLCVLAVADGQTDKEIAKRDGLSPRSIKGRIESAMYKLGVYRRPALIAEAMRRGLITPMIIALCAILIGQSTFSDTHANRIRRTGEGRMVARRAESTQTV